MRITPLNRLVIPDVVKGLFYIKTHSEEDSELAEKCQEMMNLLFEKHPGLMPLPNRSLAKQSDNLVADIAAVMSRQKNKNKPDDEGVFLAKIEMDVKSTAHGKVRVYGKIFGENGRKFLGWYKELKPQDQVIKLDGFYQQYEIKGRNFSKYVFFDWEKRPDETPRAGFILTGELARTEMEAAVEARKGGKVVNELIANWTASMKWAVQEFAANAQGALI